MTELFEIHFAKVNFSPLLIVFYISKVTNVTNKECLMIGNVKSVAYSLQVISFFILSRVDLKLESLPIKQKASQTSFSQQKQMQEEL